MTREEAVERLKRLKRSCRDLAASMPEEPGWALHGMALDMAITALRPVSREQVEKVWKVSDPKTRPFKFSNEMEDWEYHG